MGEPLNNLESRFVNTTLLPIAMALVCLMFMKVRGF